MSNNDYGDCLAIPPMDTTFDFSDLNDDVFLNDLDFDFDFDFSIDQLLNDFPTIPESSSSPDNQIFESDGSNKEDTQGSENCSGDGVVDQRVGLDGFVEGEGNKKRKKDDCNGDVDISSNKHEKSGLLEEDKVKVRLMRNRESAHLSRQRKKHYVEDLEGKVRSMRSTIQELNAKIAYIVAENASLKQQMGGVVPSPMMYSWMPALPYVVNPYGSQPQLPLMPIPRLRPRDTVPAPKGSKKNEDKKSRGRTKKVASVSFLGLLFFMVLFGGLVPMVNVRYGGTKDTFMGRLDFVSNGHYEKHHGRVLTVDGDKISEVTNSKFSCGRRDYGEGELSAKHGGCGFAGEGNGSEPLMASLYVPRNDKLVKIDGNLIIHSILASEKATKPGEDHQEKTNDETGLALLGDLVPSDPRRNAGRHPHLALGSGGERKTITADHQLHQWFREGLAGSMLSSGKCTEVFQFDVLPAPGAIISATSRNVSTASSKNSTHVNRGRNRRMILHGLPIPLPGSSAQNISEEGTGRDAGNGKYPGTNSSSSMVVSVLLDPREAADAEVDGVMRVKSLSRIFVVVLIDGVKYVTYSCMFPFKGAGVPHL